MNRRRLLSRGLVPKTNISRVEKRKAASSPDSRPAKKTVEKNSLLSAILQNSIVMPSCSYCEGKGYASCDVSPSDSSRCAECVRLGRSRCDVLGVGAVELRNIATQHQKLEDELQAAEEKVLRLRKQKKMWFEKMMRAVRRGIDSVEELERVEREEAEAEQRRLEEARPPSAGSDRLSSDFIGDWDTVYPDVALSPSLLAEFGLLGPAPASGERGTSEAVVGSS
ncbi:hypothetical protein Cob_v013012 [Colletotrichum orbiculare MAFF 240422]|uniref:Uncharacterized protein n=1 Tax=Colletotrichum orbiculare (strain 104-T / ATCC 96160 / CBS 514.97 / LARS 414 / MAFF 240422) TaxID=1213857 RepID=A0A484F7E0_COLOR|nr:hypothetical protein Cob_v013012 [Colletotrichum orbiculare MAFF 240422]